MLITIISFLVILTVLVFVHELGHFLAARKFGATAEEFGIGFPPRLFAWYKSSAGGWKCVWWNKEITDAIDTIYSINLIPIGGFVKIKGENGEGKNDAGSFASKPIWQRTIMLSAGVVMNVLLAAIIISFNLMVGSPQVVEGNNVSGATVSNRSIQIMEVVAGSPAERAGLKTGDKIESIGGQTFENYSQLQDFVGDKAGKTLEYVITRGGEHLTLGIVPEIMKDTDRAGVGIAIAETALVRYPWYTAIVEGVKLTGVLIWAIIVGFYELLVRLFSGAGVGADISGPVGIAVLTGQVASLGFTYLLQFAALLSLNLAVINFLPFPALDGGRVLFLIIEKIKGGPIKQRTEAIIHNVGFMILIGLILVVTFKDIFKLF